MPPQLTLRRLPLHEAARKCLELGGFVKGAYGPRALDAPHCALGAYRTTTYNYREYEVAVRQLARAVLRHWPDRAHVRTDPYSAAVTIRNIHTFEFSVHESVVIAFNDSRDTTLDDVLHLSKYAEEEE